MVKACLLRFSRQDMRCQDLNNEDAEDAEIKNKSCSTLRAPRPPCSDPLSLGSYLSHPDVPVANRITVILQQQRQLVGVGNVGRPLVVPSGAAECDVVLDQNAVIVHRHGGWPDKAA